MVVSLPIYRGQIREIRPQFIGMLFHFDLAPLLIRRTSVRRFAKSRKVFSEASLSCGCWSSPTLNVHAKIA